MRQHPLCGGQHPTISLFSETSQPCEVCLSSHKIGHRLSIGDNDDQEASAMRVPARLRPLPCGAVFRNLQEIARIV
jgi:hypothetical protein